MDAFVRATQEDDREAAWLARLSDGSVAWRDDGRPGTAGPAWPRLKARCERDGLWVVSLQLRFLENEAAPLPDDAEGYYFSRASAFDFSGRHLSYFRVGHVEDGVLRVQTWKAPELYFVEAEDRRVEGNEPWIIYRGPVGDAAGPRAGSSGG